jgi:2-polyprenyl-3-methyl-5-hydroxy-6-metoxy-1,4-benzoquinol methylase
MNEKADEVIDNQCSSEYEELDTRMHRFKRRITLNSIINLIRRIAKGRSSFSVLEIGTGSGYLLAFLEKEFPQARLTGIEFNPKLVELTRSKVKEARVFQGNAECLDLGSEEFDLVVSLQVIEHLNRPEAMLYSVRKHLAPGGVLIFTTPNLGCVSARVMKEKWHGFREDHVSLKSFREWQILAKQCGFKEVFCGSTFFTGIPACNRLPFGILNWFLLFAVGFLKWERGESFVGVFEDGSVKMKCSENH